MKDTTTTTTIDDEVQAPPTKRHLTSSSSISEHRPLPYIPFDIVAKILLKLPVKSLLRFKSTCKSWNDFISDPQFAKDHLRASASDPNCNDNRNRFLITFKCYQDNESQSYLRDYSISSVLDGSVATAAATRNKIPCRERRTKFLCGSCDGMIIMATNPMWPILWNPSTGKFKDLPPVDQAYGLVYGFGYDHIGDSYKVVVTLNYSKIRRRANPSDYQFDNLIYTLGTNSWRQIHGFAGLVVKDSSGKFVSGTLNWLACDANNLDVVRILSLDLATEVYQTLTPIPVDGRPGIDASKLRSAVLKGCLCIVANRDMVADYFVMKEYGNADSWTLMFRIPYVDVLPDNFFRFYMAPLWVSDEEDEILLEYLGMLSVYSSTHGGSFKAPGIDVFRGSMLAAVYTETLISPP